MLEVNHLFPYPWSVLTFANWKKYPNEHSTHVISVDVLSRKVDPGGTLVTERLVCCHQNAPFILKRLGIPIAERAYFYEVSQLDPVSRTYTAKTINLSMRNWLNATETCIFKPDPQSPLQHTIFSQSMQIKASGAFSMFSKIIEDAAVSRFHANAARGRKGLETVLEKIVAEAKEVEHKVTSGIMDSFASKFGKS